MTAQIHINPHLQTRLLTLDRIKQIQRYTWIIETLVMCCLLYKLSQRKFKKNTDMACSDRGAR